MDSLFKHAVAIVAFIVGAFHLLNVSGLVVLSTRDIRIFHLMMMLVLLFLTKPTLKKYAGSTTERIVSLILVALSIASSVFVLSRWKDIAMSGGDTDRIDAWVGLVLILLVLEAARRGVGVALAIICLVFFTYPFYSEWLPGVLYSRGYSVERIAELLTTTSQGIYGIPLVYLQPILFCSLYTVLFSARLVRENSFFKWPIDLHEACVPQVRKRRSYSVPF